MTSILDITFIIGVILNFTKGADLFLLESQKQKIQNYFESFTLFVDDIKPINWFEMLKQKKAQRIILLVAIGIICILIFADLYQQYSNPRNETGTTLGERINSNSLYIAFTWLLSIPFIFKFGVKLNRWILAKNNLLVFFLRYLGYTIISLVLITSMTMLSLWISSIIENSQLFDLEPGTRGFNFFIITMLVFFPFTLLFLGNLAVYNFIILFAIFQIFLNVFLVLLKAIFWRIVEYNKGVYSVIILFVTIVLGIIQVTIK